MDRHVSSSDPSVYDKDELNTCANSSSGFSSDPWGGMAVISDFPLKAHFLGEDRTVSPYRNE